MHLWQQLCECAQLHEEQAQELEMSKQVRYCVLSLSPVLSFPLSLSEKQIGNDSTFSPEVLDV
jgi:hypothetical protein